MEHYELFATQFQKFLLVFARISGIFVISPFFGSLIIPQRVKAGLALFIALLIFPVVNHLLPPLSGKLCEYYFLVISQVLIGIIIGFLCTIVVSAFQISGELYSVQMGFGFANTVDPLSQVEQPIIGQFIGLFALLIFLIIGGHHLMITAVFKSFETVPIFSLTASNLICDKVVMVFCGMFLTALKMALPIMGVLFLVTLSMGLLAKVAPMMNIMALGWAMTIVIGIITLLLITPLLGQVAQNVFTHVFSDIDELMYYIGRKAE
ncbi:flagellar biosynthetic protein FliR [Candidatus Desantisbacteria bacterium CG2_30_40_21]|uniref:Flagellar biosynthetic protein FliR n=5 Tax=unclassified Candidatus Desantisiibacteriota TaxID=3106372 RepID=A0A2M7JEN8_9BACT|nr:MAG: flagellar biosynthetic protein FliR [Candidatus Desantisbacteria bacterium CG2_30_40_21]PIP42285.1 MAG: flagellar biosynthetic protein FliR [Candidatus Desantisbacteria bacterium CG23_combo_of_CG06-09_8_20_14_all_40_23]PIX17874.1 MAG: flagellar biosynthetic protein FliR [Candidatus Desantisbacteria bacterium CG_4_8_14_3_um_filter_40_12]PIY19637.1 MAG: flagellar biosynthetic protein FliR [Candidatus Desantisbacteria bacterium CG_4_10_14_3_um_filter_40_18]PJB30246.1 MAG: flagellar biosynt